MLKFFLTLFCLSGIITGNTFTPLSDVLSRSSVNDIGTYKVKGTIFNSHENKTYPFLLQFKSDPTQGVFAKVENPICISELHLNPSFQAMSSTFNVFNQDLVERLKYNFRVGRRNQVDELVFDYQMNGKTIREKGIYYNKNTFDTFSIIPIFQVLASKDVSYVSADLAVENNGIRVPVIIKKDITNRLDQYLLKYTVHDDFKKIIQKNKKEYIVFIFKVGGWQGFIYNHRHYYIFSASAPYEYVGHWGGPDQLNIFSWVDN